jgi:hypothetical protein
MKFYKNFKYLIILFFFISACSNPVDELEIGTKYIYYSDGSRCTETNDEKCVTREFINKLCKVKNVGVTRLLATSYGLNRDFRELAEANGVSSEVFIDNNKCGLRMTTAGIYRGTSTRVTYTCDSVNSFVKQKDGQLLVYHATSCWTLN